MVYGGSSAGGNERHGPLFCLCADDFGLSEGVSRGILAALAAERLSAVSVMTTRPGWRAAARDLAASAFPADLGLHLNFTLAEPLTKMPRLAPAGLLPALPDLLAAAQSGQFVDSHRHVHVLPGVRRALFEVLKGKGLAGLIWLRNPGDHPWRILRRQIGIKAALDMSGLARPFVAEAHAQGFAVNEGFSGFAAASGQRRYAEDFAHYLVAPGPTHLVMCHPGHDDDESIRLDGKTGSREQELAFLLSPQFDACLSRHHAGLGRLKGHSRP
jgi:chitin disaccharide deacetylase